MGSFPSSQLERRMVNELQEESDFDLGTSYPLKTLLFYSLALAFAVFELDIFHWLTYTQNDAVKTIPAMSEATF